MRRVWRTAWIAAGAALVVVLGYALSASTAQLHALWEVEREIPPQRSTAVIAVDGDSSDRESPIRDGATAQPARAGESSSEHEPALAPDSLEASLPESSSGSGGVGPPTGAEFARLVEQGLIEDADAATVEQYLHAVRETAEPAE